MPPHVPRKRKATSSEDPKAHARKRQNTTPRKQNDSTDTLLESLTHKRNGRSWAETTEYLKSLEQSNASGDEDDTATTSTEEEFEDVFTRPDGEDNTAGPQSEWEDAIHAGVLTSRASPSEPRGQTDLELTITHMDAMGRRANRSFNLGGSLFPCSREGGDGIVIGMR